jgi:hypothetical protein
MSENEISACIILAFAGGLLLGILIGKTSPLYHFYKGYFEQKQRNAGRDPQEVLRSEGVL